MSDKVNTDFRGDVLIVDDTPANLRLLSQILIEQGYKVRAVMSGARALAAAWAVPPDLVLLDIRMPEMNGYEVCAHLKADERTCEVPIIFISALNEADDKVNAFNVGAVDYITKPFQFAEVLARVETHLTLRRTQQQLQAMNTALEQRLTELDQANVRLQQEIVHRQRAEEMERQRVQEMEALRTTMTEISGELDLTRLLRAILERAVDLIGATDGELSLYDEIYNNLNVLATYHLNVHTNSSRQVIGEEAASLVATTHQPLIINDCQTAIGHLPIYEVPGAQAALLVPMLAGERLIGVISVGNSSPARKFDAQDAELLSLFAQQATIAIQNARLFAEVQTLASTDPLTGLYNRRHFFDLAQREIERATRANQPLSVVMLDVDYFKQVNDCYGHLFGDHVLQMVAKQCRSLLRTMDVLARYGGEEFVIMLPGTPLDHAQQVAERLRQHIAQTSMTMADTTVQITISLGVAELNIHDHLTLDGLLSHTDQALYLAKQAGRNQVVCWGNMTLTMPTVPPSDGMECLP